MSLNDTQGKNVTRRLQHKRGRRSREEMRQLQLEREELETVSFPVCTAHPDCHACRNGRCMALDRNDFGRRDCPFYKNSEINRREQREGLEKLIRMGRTDLIDKYKRTFQELGIFGMSDSFTEQATASCIYTQKRNKKIRKPQAANQTALIFDRRAAARLLSINSIRRLCWS